MKTILNKIVFVFLIVLLTKSTYAQYQWGPEYSTYRRSLQRSGSGNVPNNGLSPLNTLFQVGKDYNINKRAVYQWEITDNDIPDNSTITSVRLYFTYSRGSHSYQLPAYFYNISLDIVNPDQNQLNDMWDDMNSTSEAIGTITGVNDEIDFVSNDSEAPFNQSVKNSLPNNKFVLGIMWTELPSVDWRIWGIHNPYLTLTIEYIPPQKLVTLDQRLNNNVQVGKLRKWEGADFTPYPYINPGAQFSFPLTSVQTIQGDQSIISNQKYNNWNNDLSNVQNHQAFTILNETNELRSNFNTTQTGISIKNSLELSSTNGGTIRFKDPWLIDYEDPDYQHPELLYYYKRNRGMDNDGPDKLEFKSRTSPFYPDYSTNYNGDVYKGVFLNQTPDPNNPDKPYYSVKAISPQQVTLYNTGVPSGRSHNFYFQNWAATPTSDADFENANNIETGVVFKNDGVTINANMKGTQLSTQTDAFDNSSQRRFVATSFNSSQVQCNVQHLVYESMGKVWYEYKYMFPGEDWTLAEPFFYGNAKNPSIDYFDNWVAIVYQEQASSGYKIILRFMVDGNETGLPIEVFHETDDNFSNDADPIVAIGTDITGGDPNNIVVGWKRSSSSNNRSAGYYFKFASRDANGIITWKYDSDFSPKYHFQTNLNSVHGAVSITKKFISASSSYLKYNFVFEQQDNMGDGSIVYAPFYYDNTIPKFDFLSKSVVSYGNGFTSNTHPSIISVLDTSARITWLGFRETEEEFWKLGKIKKSKTESGFYHTFFSDPGYPNHFWDFGNEVFSPTINKLTMQGNEAALQKYYLAWSESEGARNYIVDNSLSRNNIQQLNTSGKNIQLSNGFQYSSAGKMQYSMSLNSDNLPYYFTSSQNVSALFNKPSILSTSSGREGIVSKGNAHFYFVIGDIFVNNEEIDFVRIPDTARISSSVDLNEHLISEPFILNNNSSFVYSVQYGTLDTASAKTALASNAEVSFKVELIDAISGEVFGVYDEVHYNLFNLVKYTNVAYSVSSSGIGERLVRVRLVVGSNLDATYSVSERYSTESILPKTRYKEIGFQGKLGVTEYALEQNYPNPFNPVTTIRYQIPKAGRVTLKVYDILGKEIATLVNEEKETGRYTVNFDASALSSGVYLYEIVVNDYRAVKKLMTIK